MTEYDTSRMQEAARIYGRFLGSGYERYCAPPAELVAKNPTHWAWAEAWESGSAFLTGPEGTGKSSMARFLVCKYAAVWRDSTDWDDMEWVAADLYCPEFEMATRDHSYDGARILRGLIDHAKYCGLLLLDDLDRAQWRDAGLDALRTIINQSKEMSDRHTQEQPAPASPASQENLDEDVPF